MATDTKGEGSLTEASEGYTLAWNSRRYISFYSITLGITLGCVAVSSLEAGPLVLARVGSKTGAATFLDLHGGKIQKHKSFFSQSSKSNFSCSYFTSPQLPAREGNWFSNAKYWAVHAMEIQLPHWLDVDWLEGMVIIFLASSMHRTYKSGREWYPKFC